MEVQKAAAGNESVNAWTKDTLLRSSQDACLTYCLTHSLTHSLPHSLTHSLTHFASLTHSPALALLLVGQKEPGMQVQSTVRKAG
jgi:hypothetical protein